VKKVEARVDQDRSSLDGHGSAAHAMGVDGSRHRSGAAIVPAPDTAFAAFVRQAQVCVGIADPNLRPVSLSATRRSLVGPRPRPCENANPSSSRRMAAQGVGSKRPTRTEASKDQVGRHEVEDRLLVAVATMALDLLVPAEAASDLHFARLDRDE
jgi:hypothetical protein